MERGKSLGLFYIFCYVYFFLLCFGCATTRNNGVGTGDAGKTYIESASNVGKIESGVESIDTSVTDSKDRITASVEQIESSEQSIGNAKDSITESIRINYEISAILQRIRNREHNTETKDKHTE